MAEFGEILQNIGEFGLFQKLTLAALCFPNVGESFLSASFIFIQSDPERHCNTDWILQADSNLTTDEQLNLTLPREEDGTFSRCQMFVPVDWDIGDIREYGLNETTGCHNGWVYGNSLYEATIVTDFDLVCDRENLVRVAQSLFMVGVLAGSFIFGPLAESLGRKRTNQISAVLLFIFTVATAFCPNVYVYMAFLFMVGVGGGGYRVNSMLLVTEWVGPSKRSWGACMTQIIGATGQCILAGLMYFIRRWRLAQLIMAAPFAVLVIYIWFIPESVRWLLSRGRTEEAKQLIIKAATINKRTVPDSLLEQIAKNDVVQKRGLQVIFRSSILTRYFFIVLLGGFSVSLAAYSLYLNVGNFGLSIFLTQLLFGVFEITAILLAMWLLEVFGRRKLFISTLLTGGLASMLILAVPKGQAIAVTSLATAARFFLAWAGSVSTIFMQELFPTSVRQSASAFEAMAARLGGILAPLLNILSMYHWSIPTAVFSSFALISGALCFLLPETTRKELPESTDEAENNRNVTSTKTENLKQQSTKL
ncbi:solute carrier family 22 member 13-like [Centropristis striata]|uniref:solute carrier family 22 member 13-like n=1 Tax=Centropristis striata TaxID=184440 RepID=UPI0027DF4335|nr:solute carrier family 22 member 13-like [Centropristis striata]